MIIAQYLMERGLLMQVSSLKRLLAVVLGLGLVCLTAACGGGNVTPENVYIADEADSGQTVTMSVGDVLPSVLGSPGALTCSAYSADCSPNAPYATLLSQAPDWHDQNTIARSPLAAVKSRLVPEGPSRR